MPTMTTQELLDVFKTMTVLELNDELIRLWDTPVRFYRLEDRFSRA